LVKRNLSMASLSAAVNKGLKVGKYFPAGVFRFYAGHQVLHGGMECAVIQGSLIEAAIFCG
jgi:hypothetical protein